MADLRGKTVLVTGATGFIGGRVVQWLHEHEGARVVPLVRRYQQASRIARLPLEMRRGDVTDIDSLRAAAAGCDYIVHAAVTFEGSREQQRRVAVDGMRNVLQVAREIGAKRTVYTSTISVYGALPDARWTEDTPCNPTDDYGRDKLEAERVLDAAVASGIPAITLRLPVVYGPWSFWSTYAISRAVAARLLLPLNGQGFCPALYVDDAVAAIVAALDAPFDPANHTFLIAAETPRTWKEFYDAHAQVAGLSTEIEDIPADRLRKIVAPGPMRAMFKMIWENRGQAGLLLELPLGRPIAKTLKWLVRTQVEEAPAAGNGAPPAPAAVEPQPAKPLLLPEPGHLDILASRAVADVDRAKRALGFAPRFSLEEGANLTAQWARWAGIGGTAA